MTRVGDTRIELWITGITDSGATALMDTLAELLVKEGYGVRDEDNAGFAVIASFAIEMPNGRHGCSRGQRHDDPR